MAKILLIESATDICSVAIAKDGLVLAVEEVKDRSSHTSMITIFIQKCVEKSGIKLSELDAVALSKGPGSYTSLRVGASVAKGLCYTLNKPLIAISTLSALAHASKMALPKVFQREVLYYLPMIDARRMEVYTGMYDGKLQLVGEEFSMILTNNLFSDFNLEKNDFSNKELLVLSGNGSEKIANGIKSFKNVIWVPQECSAVHLSALAEQKFLSSDYQSVSYFIPTYIKSPNITMSKSTHF